MHFAQTQLIFYEQFINSIEKHIECFKKKDKIVKSIEAMRTSVSETKEKMEKITKLEEIPDL